MCEKKKFDSEHHAKGASRGGERRGRRWLRPYQCDECHAWHLTSFVEGRL